ncbi:ABC transporter substrate-binding protein [Sphingomonas jatrophae]|uniref:2'-hydroxybiphenyl-2-sulfinate desulfinase n=1 Tax=Sphingomonas jatrophae TaxID=1166337 RepID=A0A1I6KA20_9SPHN|nr:ABC transporter substrate-binding protein [Sphingomonas jatrophae]SFR88103.1 2'-hydroxybiphenyl-2-sulfinate desulfinase [Sphingomonas jatrophae]
MATLDILDRAPDSNEALSELWFTRCPVPTATGLAYRLGRFEEAFAPSGIAVRTLQETPGPLQRHHYDHRLPTLIREGGNILAIAARAQHEPTKLVGLTWIEERQVILVRPESGIASAADLKGKRLGLPTWIEHEIPSHARGSSIARGMSLAGYHGALASAGLTLDDVELVEVDSRRRDANPSRDSRLGNLWAFPDLVAGRVDALYVKGASAVDGAREAGLAVAVDLDALPDRRFRVNNGTPRPITVHQSLIDDHFEHLVTFLEQTLRTADWARDNLDAVLMVLENETRGTRAAVEEAYGNGFHASLHPDLSDERLALFDRQKRFLWVHGFLERDFDLTDWVDHRPLAAARERLRQRP